jgi:hypothetical protein
VTTRTSNSRRDQAIADDFLDGEGVCAFCRGSARKDDLNNFGARCRPCYELCCTGGRVALPLSAEDRRAMADRVRAALSGRLRLSGPDHIAMLQRRADAGENLSPGQRGFLAAVRRASGRIDDESAPPAIAAPAAPIHAPPAPVRSADPEPWSPMDEPPPWAVEDAGLSDAAEFPAPNDVGVTV